MKDADLIKFMKDYAHELQVKAAKGSPICKDILRHYQVMQDSPDKEEAAAHRTVLEQNISDFYLFKGKGWL